MKMKKIIALTLSVVMAFAAFTACSDAETESSDIVVISSESQNNGESQQTAAPQGQEGYTFVYNGVNVRPNTYMNDILSDLNAKAGEPSYFESASCAGLGMSKTYTYNSGSFVISTNPVGDKDLIASVALFDDTVATAENIHIGSSVDEVKAAYGEPGEGSSDTTFTYELSDTMLVIVITDNVVSSIVYIGTM